MEGANNNMDVTDLNPDNMEGANNNMDVTDLNLDNNARKDDLNYVKNQIQAIVKKCEDVFRKKQEMINRMEASSAAPQASGSNGTRTATATTVYPQSGKEGDSDIVRMTCDYYLEIQAELTQLRAAYASEWEMAETMYQRHAEVQSELRKLRATDAQEEIRSLRENLEHEKKENGLLRMASLRIQGEQLVKCRVDIARLVVSNCSIARDMKEGSTTGRRTGQTFHNDLTPEGEDLLVAFDRLDESTRALFLAHAEEDSTTGHETEQSLEEEVSPEARDLLETFHRQDERTRVLFLAHILTRMSTRSVVQPRNSNGPTSRYASSSMSLRMYLLTRPQRVGTGR
jgi:hypothetical protein